MQVYRRAVEAFNARIIKPEERSEIMATTYKGSAAAAWIDARETRRLCHGRTVQHICREGCDWIDEPIDAAMMTRKVLVTPKIAAAWLKRNGMNRLFSRDSARLLASEMAHGYWRENGESIIFDRTGVLIDGQHRLQAIVDSNHEYLAPIITGIEESTRPTVDTGKKRSSAQNLQMAGEKNASTLSAALTLWKGYLNRDLRAMTHPQSASPERRTTISRVLEDVKTYPEMQHAVERAIALRAAGQGRALIPSSETALIWQAIVQSGGDSEQTNAFRADAFLGSVLSGYNLTEDSPIIGLRRRLIDQMGPGLKMDKKERLALVLKTWLLWSAGKTRKVIRWDSGTEPFPFLD